MKERPILFSGPMVRAILDGRKTQTRRVMKPQPKIDAAWYPTPAVFAEFWSEDEGKNIGYTWRCPYGQRGDRLWVRETWRIASFWDGEPMVFDYKDGGRMEECCEGQDALNYEDWIERMCTQSTEDCERAGLVYGSDGYYHWEKGNSPCRWRPSIHMPRWASRLTLEVVSVRVERVQDIMPFDCEAEGITGKSLATPVRGQPYEEYQNGDGLVYTTPVAAFRSLWDRINERRSYGWESNPWVWIVEFRKVEA